MELCLICHEPTNDRTKNFCDRCLHMSIEELDRLYKERDLHSGKEDQVPHVNNPNEEAAHKL